MVLPSVPAEPNQVLVVGIYLTDAENHAVDTIEELTRSRDWTVRHSWASLGTTPPPQQIASQTDIVTTPPVPKFVLLNRLLQRHALEAFRHILVVDDDIQLPSGFLDSYLRLVERHDLALAQPARTHDSFIDHRFVEQLDGIDARWTNFVEIGPLFSMRHDAIPHLVPFDEGSPMGWGYDFVWPRVLGAAGLRLGIVDATPVQHTLRKPVSGYSYADANQQQAEFLAARPHVTKAEAFRIFEPYA